MTLARTLRKAGIYPPTLRILDALVPVSLALLALFAFTIPLSHTISNAALVAVAIGSLPLLLWSRELRGNPVVILSAAWCLFVVLVALRAEIENFPGHHIRSVGKGFLLALSPVLAIQIAVLRARSRWSEPALWAVVLGCGALGVTALLLHNPNWRGGLDLFAEYNRMSAAFNRNYVAFVSGMALLALLSLGAWAWEESRLARRWRLALTTASTGLLLIIALALFTIQSRSSWIAAALGVCVWLSTFVLAGLRRKQDLLRAAGVTALFVAVLSALAIASAPTIQQRLGQVGGVERNLHAAKELALGRTDAVRAMAGEVDPRYQLFLVANDLIAQKPLLGWGPDVTSLIGLFSPFEEVKRYTQFHNGYLQFLVSVGFVGAALQALLVAAMVRDAWRTRRRRLRAGAPPGSAAMKAAFASLLAFNLVVNFTESNFFLNAGAMVLILLGAALCLNGSVGADTKAALARLPAEPA